METAATTATNKNAQFDQKYTIIEHIARGGFGMICRGKNMRTQQPVAMKFEQNNEYNLLIHEATMLNYSK